jgi:predicted NAD/FAD-binding protein
MSAGDHGQQLADAGARPTAAVVGAGIAGLTAAYLLSRSHEVRIYEAGRTRRAADAAFLVHNDRTHPLLRRLLADLGVDVRPADMSVSIREEATGLEYVGGSGAAFDFEHPGWHGNAGFWTVISQVPYFHRRVRAYLSRAGEDDPTTYGDFLRLERFSAAFVRLYAVPLATGFWSAGGSDVLDRPAGLLLRLLDQQGLLRRASAPQWFALAGGARAYVDAISARLPDARTGTAAVEVLRGDREVWVTDERGERQRHDRVVVATHADDALRLLADPSAEEKDVLGSFAYDRREAVLHTDSSLLAGGSRAAWSYLVTADAPAEGPVLTCCLNLLQGLSTDRDLLLTLDAGHRVDPARVLDVEPLDCLVLDTAAADAQRRLPGLASGTTAYAGSYHGWGLPEDACRSGVEAARWFGATW